VRFFSYPRAGQALSAVVLRFLALCALLAALAPGCGGASLSSPTLDAGSDGSLCPNYVLLQSDGTPTLFPCCPVPTPDCSGLPDGAPPSVPGLENPDGSPVNQCTPRDNPYCSCGCSAGQWQCGC
jgi:hypothetical protein